MLKNNNIFRQSYQYTEICINNNKAKKTFLSNKDISSINKTVLNNSKINALNKIYYKNNEIKREVYYEEIFNYLQKTNSNIKKNRYPKRITNIKSKTSRENAKKQFRKKIKRYIIDKESNRLLYKKFIRDGDKTKKRKFF